MIVIPVKKRYRCIKNWLNGCNVSNFSFIGSVFREW